VSPRPVVSVAAAPGSMANVSDAGARRPSVLRRLALLFQRAVLGAPREQRPSVEELSETLSLHRSPEGVARAVEATVRRWLPCEEVRFELRPSSSPGGDGVRESIVERRSETRLRGDGMVIGAWFRGAELGVLHVGPRRDRARFTPEDADLLRTIATLAAVALAHIDAYGELEERRRQQVAAFRGERERIVETLAAEIAHEIRYPINFFRSVFGGGPRALDAEEVDIGLEEIARLEKLVAGLRPAYTRKVVRSVTPLGALVDRAELLVRDSLGVRGLCRDFPAIAVRCDPDLVLQVLVNLLSNGAEAAGTEGSLGVAWRDGAGGGTLVVWDDGPGFSMDPKEIFTLWFTTKPRGTGLGLAIVTRLARAHGWTVDARRHEGRTELLVVVPETDIVRLERARDDEKGVA
jgi:two-component system, NtrC family, sensor histidine kinase HydH